MKVYEKGMKALKIKAYYSLFELLFLNYLGKRDHCKLVNVNEKHCFYVYFVIICAQGAAFYLFENKG